MAAPLHSAARRSVATITSTALRAPACQVIAAKSALQRGALSAANRGLCSISQNSRSLATCPSRSRYAPSLRQHVRRNSGNGSSPVFREWGFEEINASLPASTSSPSHTPVILIDVREPAELTGTGIIPTAINIPLASQPDALYLTADEFETRFGFPKPSTDAEQQIVFYCKAGVRARAAAQLAVQAGYKAEQLGVYDGSWLDWERQGGKTERWEGDHA
ncbi:Thiosulfate sulfurtransferase RDL1 [Penicillium rolfsii]|nr:Thiosulfate sulfurtransferase RDL1 [Penicillium rolfsii]